MTGYINLFQVRHIKFSTEQIDDNSEPNKCRQQNFPNTKSLRILIHINIVNHTKIRKHFVFFFSFVLLRWRKRIPHKTWQSITYKY